jgi:DNA ligase (NAD+)
MKKTKADEIVRLVNDLRLHRYLYYNKQPRIDDAAFDALLERLRQLDPTNEVLLETGAPPDKDSGWQKVAHYMRLSSLANSMSEDEFRKWAAGCNVQGKVFVGEDKFDGLSVELVYDEGKLAQGITRGDGRQGEDITINIAKMQYVKLTIPEKAKLSVRGEIMLFKQDFETINAEIVKSGEKPYANPRNAAGGICKRFDGKYSEFLRVVTYDVVSSDLTFTYETEKMDYLNHTLGFVTANYKLLTSEGIIQLRKDYTDSLRDKLPYFIDGIVVKVNNITRQKEMGIHSNGDPKSMTAFKFDARGVATTLMDCVPTIGRTGVITPNAVIDPVNIDGSMVKAASIHNYDEIERLGLGIGDTILVIKAGEIIPKITQVIKSAGQKIKAPTVCPKCGGPVVRRVDENGKEGALLYCDNEECEGREFRKLRYWVDTLKKRMGLDGVGESTVEQLYEKGLIKDPADFYAIKAEDILALDRSGDKLAKKVVEGFEKTKEMDLVTFLAGLGISSLGTTMAETLAEEFDLFALTQEATVEDLAKIPNVGQSRAQDIIKGLEQRAPLIEKLMQAGIKIKKASAVQLVSNKLQGKSFQVTGGFTKTNPKTSKPYKREEWNEFVAENGGIVARVNKDLNYLVAIKSSSNKIKKAIDLGVKTISEDEFWTMME